MAKGGMSPTQRTMKELRRRGLTPGIVEKWNRYGGRPGGGGVRQDLFGIIDIIALDPHRGVVGVQTTGKDFAGHLRKLLVERTHDTIRWLTTPGAHLELWSWRLVKVKRGGKAVRWEPRIKVITLADIPEYNPLAPLP